MPQNDCVISNSYYNEVCYKVTALYNLQGQAYVILALMEYAISHALNMHAQLPSGANSPNFGLSLPLLI